MQGPWCWRRAACTAKPSSLAVGSGTGVFQANRLFEAEPGCPGRLILPQRGNDEDQIGIVLVALEVPVVAMQLAVEPLAQAVGPDEVDQFLAADVDPRAARRSR